MKTNKKSKKGKKNNINTIFNNYYVILPLYTKRKTQKKIYSGGNKQSLNFLDCMRRGFCSGEFKSTVPDYLQEYAVTEFSNNDTTNQTGDLHKTIELNSNLSIGDSNYTPASPPEGAYFNNK